MPESRDVVRGQPGALHYITGHSGGGRLRRVHAFIPMRTPRQKRRVLVPACMPDRWYVSVDDVDTVDKPLDCLRCMKAIGIIPKGGWRVPANIVQEQRRLTPPAVSIDALARAIWQLHFEDAIERGCQDGMPAFHCYADGPVAGDEPMELKEQSEEVREWCRWRAGRLLELSGRHDA